MPGSTDSFYVFRESDVARSPLRVPASEIQSLDVVSPAGILKPFSLTDSRKPLVTLSSPKSGITTHFTSNRAFPPFFAPMAWSLMPLWCQPYRTRRPILQRKLHERQGRPEAHPRRQRLARRGRWLPRCLCVIDGHGGDTLGADADTQPRPSSSSTNCSPHGCTRTRRPTTIPS